MKGDIVYRNNTVTRVSTYFYLLLEKYSRARLATTNVNAVYIVGYPPPFPNEKILVAPRPREHHWV